MEEIRIGGSPRDRRIGLIALAVSLVVAVAFGLWSWLTGDPLTGNDSRPLVAIIAAVIFMVALWVSYLSFGYSTVSASHLKTRLFLRRRSVPWPEIAAVELHSQTGRGSTVWMVRVRLKAGRSFIVPGTQLVGSQHEDALAKLKIIEKYRTRCVGKRAAAPDA